MIYECDIAFQLADYMTCKTVSDPDILRQEDNRQTDKIIPVCA